MDISKMQQMESREYFEILILTNPNPVNTQQKLGHEQMLIFSIQTCSNVKSS